MTPIRIESVSKRFGRTVAIDSVSLDIGEGEIFFLLGPSGCGKTTLLRVVAGLEVPDEGRVFLGETDVTDLPARLREAVMVFQSYALWPHMSVERNVSFGLEVRSVPRAERERSVRRALEQVKLEALAARKPGQLSGGQQQRVALARALVVKPRVLLLDEPLSNLDAALRSEMRGEIRRLCNEAGLTALYVTHDQHEALAVADRIALLDAGRIVQVGTPREIYTRPASRFAAEFMGVTNIIEARVAGLDPALLETALGTFGATRLPVGIAAGDAALVSVRPEAWRRGKGTHGVSGRVATVAFLGDHAEYVVEAEGGRALRVTERGPGTGVFEAGDMLELHVDPVDVLVLPAGPGEPE
ncbi:MAG: ABC transporter ATP-binding protein [Deltaproteobacteria bacterium]|nr:ABC transporter ATP-binding protein [Deltaproteobacteria bacterium]